MITKLLYIVELIVRCQQPDLTLDEWWIIGGYLHTIHGDFKYIYPEQYAAMEFESTIKLMWEYWCAADPREKVQHDNA